MRLKRALSTGMAALLCALWFGINAYAAEISGGLDTVDSAGVKGWAWNTGIYNEVIGIEIHIYKDGGEKAAKVVTLAADDYDGQLEARIGDGYHGFDCKIDWAELGGSSYKVEAYAQKDGEKILLPGAKVYTPGAPQAVFIAEAAPISGRGSLTGQAPPVGSQTGAQEIGPGVPKKPVVLEVAEIKYKKGNSLGIFRTTGYSLFDESVSGGSLTYSGTVPQPGHTISADISLFPIGTKLMIGDTVYTVEDIGGSVDERKLDVFYGSHEEALAHGVQNLEVFEVIEE